MCDLTFAFKKSYNARSGVRMVERKQNSNIKNRRLIFSLNYVYSGLHGQVKCLLQFVNHYFKLKRLNQNENAQEILKIIVVKIDQIIMLKSLITELGGEIEILSYIANTYQYHTDKRPIEQDVDKLFLEQISSETLFIKECQRFFNECKNQKAKQLLNSFIEQSENNIKVINHLKKRKNVFNLI